MSEVEATSLKRLVDLVADDVKNISKAQTKRVLDSFLTYIKGTVEGGQKVKLAKFGSFEPMLTPPTMRTNPQNGERFEAPAKRRVKFTTAPAFKELLK